MSAIFEQVGLSTIVVAPACVAVILLIVSGTVNLLLNRGLPSAVWYWSGLLVSLLVFAATAELAVVRFDPEWLGPQLVDYHVWSPGIGANLAFAVDGLSLCFLLSTAGLVPLTFVTLRGVEAESLPARVMVILILESALVGGLLAVNWVVFVVCWTISGLPILVWMARFGDRDREQAALRLWVTEAIGLVGLLLVLFVLHEVSLEQLGVPSLDLISVERNGSTAANLLDVRLDLEEQWTLFFAFALALGIRLPLAPLHFWLPPVHAAAPTGLSVLIATGFVQVAAVGWMRFALPLVPDAAYAAGPVLSILGIGALAYASLIALVQKELKRLVAYASVGYAGYALFGMSMLNAQGLTGAVLQLLTHGLATAGLFLLIGFLAARRGTTEVSAFGGLAKPMPVCAFFFGVMTLSLMGLPLLGGFVGDLFVLLGSLETRRTLSLFALLAMLVAASYLLWVQRRVFLGPVDEPANRGLIDLDRLERAVLLAITLPIVAIGVYPNPVLRRVEPAILDLLYQMERRSVVREATDAEPDAPATSRELALLDAPHGGER